jgi:peptidoglycan/xylan/chitin deacetylase (PgdA/CDA1 family)
VKRAQAASTAGVLLYHRVAELPDDRHALAVPPADFRAQIEQLRSSWQVLPLATLAAMAAAGDLPDRAVALTFDDGYVDNLEVAAPILAELGVPATFFLTAESLDLQRHYWWDLLDDVEGGGEEYVALKAAMPVVRDDIVFRRGRRSASLSRPMIASEIARLAREFPLIEIGAHGLHHLSLPMLSPEDCFREVSESRSALERVIGRPVISFAYPFGDVSPQAMTAVMAAGFQQAVTCEARGVRAREHPLRLPRLPSLAALTAL